MHLHFILHLFQDKIIKLIDIKIVNNSILRKQIINLLLIAFLYQAFRNCIKNLTCVDDTLEKLGIRTDYKLYKKTIWLILGWFISAIIIICLDIPVLRKKNDSNIAQTMYILFIRIYCIHINIINDLIITSMLGLVYSYKYIRIFCYTC